MQDASFYFGVVLPNWEFADQRLSRSLIKKKALVVQGHV